MQASNYQREVNSSVEQPIGATKVYEYYRGGPSHTDAMDTGAVTKVYEYYRGGPAYTKTSEAVSDLAVFSLALMGLLALGFVQIHFGLQF